MEAGQDKAQAVADAEATLTAKDAELAAVQGRLAAVSESAAAAEEHKVSASVVEGGCGWGGRKKKLIVGSEKVNAE
jgi:hypothetical protein